MSNNEMVSVPRELTDEMAEALASKANVCGGIAFEAWEAVIAAVKPVAQHQAELVALTVGDRIEWMQKFDGDLWEDWMGDDSITTERLPSWMTENGVPERLESSQLVVLLQAKIKHLEQKLADQPVNLTAVDMTTAVADGFRDGQAADALKAFSREMIDAAFEGGSFDGGDIQDIAVKHGLLRIEPRNEECGEVCACREYGFPAECYRKTDLIAKQQ